MQVESISSVDVENGKAMKRAMGLLAAFAVAATAAITVTDVSESDFAPRALKTDAIEYGVRATSPAQTPTAPAREENDSELGRPDRGSDQHG